MLDVLIIGAGAVGSVVGRHLSAGGPRVSALLRAPPVGAATLLHTAFDGAWDQHEEDDYDAQTCHAESVNQEESREEEIRRQDR